MKLMFFGIADELIDDFIDSLENDFESLELEE